MEGGLATLRLGVEFSVLHPRVGNCTLRMGATLRMGEMVQALGLGVQRLKSECKNSRLQGWEYKDLHFKNGSATLAIGVLSGKRPTKGLFKMPQKQDTLYHFYLYHLICHPLNLIVAPGLCKNITPLLRNMEKSVIFISSLSGQTPQKVQHHFEK